METQTLTVNWQVLLPYLLSALAPTIVGLLQQVSTKVSEKAPWYAKVVLTAVIGALITFLTDYAANTDASALGGAVVATLGSVNIALRKGVSRYLPNGNNPPEVK